MYKIGVMKMGKMRDSPKKVKEIILEVQGKTKISNIAEYLLEMGKISNTNVQFSLQKNGQAVSQSSNITQALKYTTPVQGIIKLYLYQKDELNATHDQLKPIVETQKQQTKISSNPPPATNGKSLNTKQVQKQNSKESKVEEIPQSSCCC